MYKIAKVTKSLDKNRIDQILVKLGLVDSRQKATSFIISGYVFLNERKVVKPGTIVRSESTIKVRVKEHNWVSRGGTKLDYALKYFNIDVVNQTCVDIGSSTGGFTDVLLPIQLSHCDAKLVGKKVQSTPLSNIDAAKDVTS